MKTDWRDPSIPPEIAPVSDPGVAFTYIPAKPALESQVEIEFMPGEVITKKAWWVDFAKPRIKDVGLWWIFEKAGVKRIEVCDLTALGYAPATWGTYRQDRSAILHRDIPPMPTWLYPALLLHEAWHMFESRLQINPSEVAAYTITQIYHTLRGEDVNVFNSDFYPVARGLR